MNNVKILASAALSVALAAACKSANHNADVKDLSGDGESYLWQDTASNVICSAVCDKTFFENTNNAVRSRTMSANQATTKLREGCSVVGFMKTADFDAQFGSSAFANAVKQPALSVVRRGSALGDIARFKDLSTKSLPSGVCGSGIETIGDNGSGIVIVDDTSPAAGQTPAQTTSVLCRATKYSAKVKVGDVFRDEQGDWHMDETDDIRARVTFNVPQGATMSEPEMAQRAFNQYNQLMRSDQVGALPGLRLSSYSCDFARADGTRAKKAGNELGLAQMFQVWSDPAPAPVNTAPTGWTDMTPGGSCAANLSNCLYKNNITGQLVTPPGTPQTWFEADKTCRELNYGGFASGWRLATLSELKLLARLDISKLTEAKFSISGPVNKVTFWTATAESSDFPDSITLLDLLGSPLFEQKSKSFAFFCLR